ncbi:hypothetical protein QWZ06_10100 [Chryseobacterium tructae]|uniref:hypothetical protein n=1 Tax=Chryseobacterium tructae TaxID=1037380 RepID=UPI0025B5B19C|nr:hypothetical protein [Chryseobacterium tructae]MDN3692604.1 hypothetical protein [Chryseobacterium tructae]
MGIIKLKGIILEPFSGNIKNIHEMHRYENGELVASTFFENSRRTRKLDFRDDERFETIYEYHQNYDAEIIYDYDQNNVEYFVSVKNPFDEYKKFDIYSADKNFLEQKIKKEGDWQQFLILKTDENEISYTFNGEKLTEMIFEIKGYEESYRINVAYSEDGKTCQVWKKYVNAEYPTIMKTYEFADNMVIEREDNQIKYTVSERERVVRIGQFSYNEEKLNLFRCYMQTQDEETFSEIMKDIRLETFNYDEFENLILHEVSFYRPDFSKDRLTPYLEEIEHFDQYNIHYGSEYCKRKKIMMTIVELYISLNILKEK